MSRKSRVPNWFWWLSGVLLIGTCVGGAMVIWWGVTRFDTGRAASEVESSARAYRARGLPFVAADIEPKPPVRPEDNAAPELTKAFKAFNYPRFNKERLQILTLVRAGKIKPAELRLLPYGPGLNMAAKASKKPRIDWNRDWDLGPMVLFPEYAPMKGLVHGFSIRAHLRAQIGDVEGAVEDLQAGLRIAALAGQEPTIIAAMVQFACEMILLDAATRVAEVVRDRPDFLALLRKTFSSPVRRPSMSLALRGEMFLGVATARNINELERKKIHPRSLQRDGLPRTTVQRGYLARHMQFWIATDEIIRSHKDDPMAMGRQIDALQERTVESYAASQRLNGILLPHLSEAGVAFVRLEATWAATRALIWALEQSAVGKQVTSLPKSFVDPFTGKPLRIKHGRNELRIYSVGPDLQDNGGVDKRELTKAEQETARWDIAASVPPVERIKANSG